MNFFIFEFRQVNCHLQYWYTFCISFNIDIYKNHKQHAVGLVKAHSACLAKFLPHLISAIWCAKRHWTELLKAKDGNMYIKDCLVFAISNQCRFGFLQFFCIKKMYKQTKSTVGSPIFKMTCIFLLAVLFVLTSRAVHFKLHHTCGSWSSCL